MSLKTSSLFSCSECGHRAKTAQEIKQHQKNIHQQAVEVSKEVCKHWRNGNCFKGNQCMFSHVGYQRNKTTESTKVTNTTSWTSPCKHGSSCSWLEKGMCQFFHRGVGVQKPAGRQQSQQSPKQQDSRKLCHFNERCYNKPTCPFKPTSMVDFSQQRRQQRHQ